MIATSLFNVLMNCVIIVLTLMSLPRDLKMACVLSIFAQHQNSRLADVRSPGWWPRLKSFLHRQTSSLPYSFYPLFPPQYRLNRGNWVSLAASSRPLDWSDVSRTVCVCQLLVSTCSIWISTILGATISPHLARRSRRRSRFSDSQLKRICGI